MITKNCQSLSMQNFKVCSDTSLHIIKGALHVSLFIAPILIPCLLQNLYHCQLQRSYMLGHTEASPWSLRVVISVYPLHRTSATLFHTHLLKSQPYDKCICILLFCYSWTSFGHPTLVDSSPSVLISKQVGISGSNRLASPPLWFSIIYTLISKKLTK